jgi:SAM-dependent methyltransferase
MISLRIPHLGIDLGHPLADRSVTAKVTVGSVLPKSTERGGSLRHWGELVTRGVGMQARWNGKPTDFFSDDPFRREDESPDHLFYRQPRLVQHIDDTAINMIRQIYGRFVQNGSCVLDLMSSWQSHLPEEINPEQVDGIGLNETEMKKNPVLTDYNVQDLNSNPELPFATSRFDTVVCTVSVEYLTRPLDVFAEVARVLKPDGWFVVTFSNRWFRTKAIQIWPQLHEFERMGLVLEYFHRTALFSDLHTYSVRGLERPAHDKYYGQVPSADPVYAVWGRRAA